LRAHGIKAFKRDILFQSWCTNRELLDIEESILIELDVRNDRNSYNTKNKGIGQDPEVTRRLFTGRKQSTTQKEKRRRTITEQGTFQGTGNGRAKSVVRLIDGTVFSYARQAATSVGGHEVGLSEACNKGCLHRGHHWMFHDEWEMLGKPSLHPRASLDWKVAWKVVRLSDGAIFDSASEAGRRHGVSASAINEACVEAQRSAAGHHWMKLTDWEESGRKLQPFTPFNRSAGVIVDCETGEQYPSATACAKAHGLSDVAVMNQAKGKTKRRRFIFLTDWELIQGTGRRDGPDDGPGFPTLLAGGATEPAAPR